MYTKKNCTRAVKKLTSYPGLLTQVFVACSTILGGGLVKLISHNDVPGHVEDWHIPGKTASECTTDPNRWSTGLSV